MWVIYTGAMGNPVPVLALRAFEAAARLLSFSRAAAELRVTPTAISHQIRRLEMHCGTALFRRRPRPLALTPAGEALFPAVRDAFQTMADAMTRLPAGSAAASLRVTSTNAIAARWLLPRLPAWRRAHPGIGLDITGTDTVLDLRAGDADVAIRYARLPPAGLCTMELLRDSFQAVASPSLVRGKRLPLPPDEIVRLPLIEAAWPNSDTGAPTWERWAAETAARSGAAPLSITGSVALRFQEELHAIEATIGGQGAAICSDVLVAPELHDGRLVRICSLRLPGYGFYVAHRADHPRLPMISAFKAWLSEFALQSE